MIFRKKRKNFTSESNRSCAGLCILIVFYIKNQRKLGMVITAELYILAVFNFCDSTHFSLVFLLFVFLVFCLLDILQCLGFT